MQQREGQVIVGLLLIDMVGGLGRAFLKVHALYEEKKITDLKILGNYIYQFMKEPMTSCALLELVV